MTRSARLVQRAVHADLVDEVEDDVLAADPGLHLALEHDLDGLRHLEPALAGRHADGHVRGADARGERADRAVGAGMAVRADDDLARSDETLLGQQRMLDAHAADLIVMDDLLRTREIAHLLGHRGGLDVLVGHEVVRDQRDLRGIEYLRGAHLDELVDRHGGGNVVAQHKVQPAHEQLARTAACDAGRSRENLLGHGHSHTLDSS